MKVLVIGGAGYIGSHAVRELLRSGHDVWIYDNLCLGHREACSPQRLIVGALADRETLQGVLRQHAIDAVMHFAAYAAVGESVADPARYYENNVAGTLQVLEAMRAENVRRIVFSSSCSVYGLPSRVPITEDCIPAPVNPYGCTKWICERMIADYAHAYRIGGVALRYFNAAGASEDGELGEDHTPETHLIPIALRVASGQLPQVTVFGDDYPTADGSCIRDYIHVDDLARAHVLALDRIAPGKLLSLNLGMGRGFSVREVLEACRSVTNHPIPAVVGARRPGDPPELVADPRQAMSLLNWQPRFTDLRPIVETAWNWHLRHPHGYSAAPRNTSGSQDTSGSQNTSG